MPDYVMNKTTCQISDEKLFEMVKKLAEEELPPIGLTFKEFVIDVIILMSVMGPFMFALSL